jgi:site-specific DNA-methyltransferase (adenine-specific)
MVSLCDDHLINIWRSAYECVGRQARFAAVACVVRGMTVRVSGDGPGTWAVYAVVSRPHGAPWHQWGALPGAYVVNREQGSRSGRGKPLELMRALVRDYTRPGDLVCDPLAGYGSTLIAAIAEGRRAVGAEMDPEAHAEAMRRAGGGAP